jgi:hypothetical protein
MRFNVRIPTVGYAGSLAVIFLVMAFLAPSRAVASQPAATLGQRVQIGTGWTPYTPFGTADWDRDGNSDIVARDGNGTLWLYPGRSVRGVSGVPRVQIGSGFTPYTPFGLADWDRDGNQDVIARDANGLLWLYPGRGVHGLAARVQIGSGFAPYTSFGATDWDGDGNQDVIVRDATGTLLLYPGRGVQGLAPRVQIGSGWTPYTPFGLADWDHDGNSDIVARDDRNGDLWLYPGRGVNGEAPRVSIGSGWTSYTPFGVPDWDRDGNSDVVARDANGTLWLYPGQAS